MSMMAAFRCTKCGTEIICGRYSGNEAHAPEYDCIKCEAKVGHRFSRYLFVDERTDAQRLREKLRGKE